MNPFPYTNDKKRYHTWNYHLRQTFGEKVFKVSLDAGFDCPNRDGTVAYGGCTFCSAAGSGDFAGRRTDDLVTQFHTIKEKCIQNGKMGSISPIFKRSQIHMPPLTCCVKIRNGITFRRCRRFIDRYTP